MFKSFDKNGNVLPCQKGDFLCEYKLSFTSGYLVEIHSSFLTEFRSLILDFCVSRISRLANK